MDSFFPITSLMLLLLVQGAGSLFLALILGTLFAYRRQPTFLYWSLAWLCNGLCLILGTLNYHFRATGVAVLEWDGEPWLQHLAVLFSGWHVALWVFSLPHFRRQGMGRPAAPLFPWSQVAALAVLAVAAVLVSHALALRERCMLLACALGVVYLWGALVAARHWQKVRRVTALLLSLTLGVYALGRLHAAGFFLWASDPDDLRTSYASVAALVDCLVQWLLAVAMILFLLDVEHTELRNVVLHLEESEERFRLIFEHSGVGMSLLTRDGRFLQVNPALVRMLGYSADELRGRRLADFVYAKDATHEKLAGPPDSETPSFYEREKRYVRKDGESIWAKVLRVPIRDGAGVTRHYVGVLINITERKRAEDALAASEQRYRLLNQVARDGIHVTDERGVFLDVNPAFCEMLGHDREFLLQRALLDVASGAGALRQYHERILQSGGDRVETRLRRRDGSLIDVEMSGALLELDGRKLLHGICRDVSERKRADEALRVARERLQEERDFSRQVIEAADVLIFVVDPLGRLMHFNRSCAAVLGWSEAEVRGKPFWEVLLPERHVEEVRASHRRLINSPPEDAPGREPPLASEMHWKAKTGEERLLSWRNATVRDAHGEVRYVISTGLDVTEQRQLEEQLRQARKMESLGTLVGGIAHDFNNQLTAILGQLALAQADLNDLADAGDEVLGLRVPLGQAEEAAQRCAEITQRLLMFSSGKVGPTSQVAPDALLAEAARALQREPGIQVQVRKGPDAWPVVGDAAALKQVVWNLADNARDAMPNGGTLTLGTANRMLQERDCLLNLEARAGRFVELSVADTGEGMTADVMSRLFEPFFTTKDPARAAGMGLAVAYGIVKAHGGWISVQSEPGEGSTFRVYLPAAEVVASARPDTGGRPDGGSECILVVDDEELVRGLAEAVLKRGGYEVITAGDGEEAVEVYRAHATRIDLVLLDYLMPKRNGLEAMRAMQQIDPRVCVIFSSGFTRDSDSDQLLATGARAFIPKPYRPDDLLRIVRHVLDEQRVDAPSSLLP